MRLRRKVTVTALSAAVGSAAALVPVSASASAAGGSHPVAEIRPGGDIGEEDCTEWDSDGLLLIDLVGIPDPVVAGEWAEFTYRISNTYEVPVDELYTFVALGAYDTNDGADIETAGQWWDGEAWVGTEGDEETGGYFGHTGPLLPGQSAEARMRVRVDEDAPERALGTAGMMGTYGNGAGLCRSTVDDLEFDVAAADSGRRGPAFSGPAEAAAP
ncbi:hypothetical protein [Streptomyces johnsoniae]|uniref:DUF11 domain-containing protein n=1 Tax=Streptomyces johnsoniae TaxID=3075532 RepID=A0ABU2SBI0_9ACTN|nr:hypothetical protein [Streptomyces sp. DSM 41886]MDT0446334.1 hypothetical protein [Streptomyces sp. DSM 41886]